MTKETSNEFMLFSAPSWEERTVFRSEISLIPCFFLSVLAERNQTLSLQALRIRPDSLNTVAYCRLDLVQLFQDTNNRSSGAQNDQKTNDGPV